MSGLPFWEQIEDPIIVDQNKLDSDVESNIQDLPYSLNKEDNRNTLAEIIVQKMTKNKKNKI